MATSGKWVSVSVGLPEELLDALEAIGDVLEAVSTILEIVSTILEIIKVFLLDITNILAVVLKALLAIVEGLLADLSQTGLYMYVDAPKPTDKGFGANVLGGMSGWRGRMAYALLSPDASNRPNFSSSASVISFHLVVTSGDIGELMASFGFLMALFKQKAAPNLNPPKNFSVRAINGEFYNEYYDDGYGRIDGKLINARQDTLLATTATLASQFETAGVAVDPENMELVLRFDWFTGEELIVEKNSGAILTTGGTPDSALLTWKLDQKLIPNTFTISRSETQGGEIETYDVLDSAGEVESAGEMVRDEEGEPVRTFDELDTVDVNFGFGQSMVGASHEQFAYLDETVEAGKAYWYQVTPRYGPLNPLTIPDVNPGASDVVKKIVALIQSILKATSGTGTPSEVKGVYIPGEGESTTARSIAFAEATASDGKWWMSSADFTGEGWTKVGIGDLFEPVILAVEELRNFVEMMLASIAGVVDQIIAFIELLQTKINTLNTFIEVIQAIIALLQVFELISFGCLFTTTDNGNGGILQALNDDSIEGVPSAGSKEYVASVTLLGGTAGVGGALNAVKLLFGLS